MLFLVGIPIFFLETSIGQFSGLSPTHVFAEMVPLFTGKKTNELFEISCN